MLLMQRSQQTHAPTGNPPPCPVRGKRRWDPATWRHVLALCGALLAIRGYPQQLAAATEQPNPEQPNIIKKKGLQRCATQMQPSATQLGCTWVTLRCSWVAVKTIFSYILVKIFPKIVGKITCMGWTHCNTLLRTEILIWKTNIVFVFNSILFIQIYLAFNCTFPP